MLKQTNQPQINIFYSYSHKDSKMQKSLHNALKTLRKSRKFKISEWYDGCIRPGQEWVKAIANNLKRSDVVLLLLSPAFIDSDYCYQKELEWALERHNDRTSLLIPVLFKDVAFRDRKFSPYQAIPRDENGSKPVLSWRPQSAAWNKVRKQLKQEIQHFVDGGLVTDANSISRVMQGMSNEKIKRLSKHDKVIRKTYDSVIQFWSEKDKLREGDIVDIKGTFSEFAPLLIGDPKGKRMLHLEFRRALEKSSKLARKKICSLNACMSISAGQMVWRDRQTDEGGITCGLYESIVRNSIPVFITRKYYDSKLRMIILNNGDTFEGRLVAKVTKRDMSTLKGFFDKYGMNAFISPTIINNLCKHSFGLLVDGESTSVTCIGKAKYLDGDIWIAGVVDGYEFFETIFLDVGDPKDREQALLDLSKRIETYQGIPRLIGQYDEPSELSKAGIDVVSNLGPFEKIFQYGFDPS